MKTLYAGDRDLARTVKEAADLLSNAIIARLPKSDDPYSPTSKMVRQLVAESMDALCRTFLTPPETEEMPKEVTP